jgi:hypothetical protein
LDALVPIVGVESVAMRRPIALVCVALLLTAALAMPLAVPTGMVQDLGPILLGLARPALGGDALSRGATLAPQVDLVQLMLFRGPPVERSLEEKRSNDRCREESCVAGTDCSRRS